MCLFEPGDLSLEDQGMTRESAANQMFALGSAAPIVGFLGGIVAQSAQKDAIEARNAAIQKSTLANLTSQYRAIARRDNQMVASAALELDALSRETAATSSRQILASAESGTTGASVAEALGSTLQAEGRMATVIRKELRDRLVESSFRRSDLHRTAAAKFASLGEEVEGPSLLGAAGGVFNTYLKAKAKYSY